jgi:hypothetical protein
MKKYPQPELHFDDKEIQTNLGSGKTIFVGSSCDMWASSIPFEWLVLIVRLCYAYPKNAYLFQTKNPTRFSEFEYPNDMKIIFGTTLESNRYYPDISGCTLPFNRGVAMIQLKGRKMISIEPIMDFDLDKMIMWVSQIKPEFVSIGADSQGHNLPEPPSTKVQNLIEELQKITKVKIKDNLKRILRSK